MAEMKNQMASADNKESSITLEFYGIKLEYQCEENEFDSVGRIIKQMQIKKEWNTATIESALRTIAHSSLAEKVAAEFDNVVNKKKKDAFVSLGACVGLYLGMEYLELPSLAEGIGYTISILEGLGAVYQYATASRAGFVVHQYLRNKA